MAGPDQIIDKSRAVIAHLIKEGKLPDDTFANAIAAAEGANPLGRDSKEYVALQVQLNEALKLAKPKTLDQLCPRHPAVRMLSLVLGIGLLVACAALTTWQTQMSGILTEFDKNKVAVQKNNVVALIPVISTLAHEDIGDYRDLGSQARVDLRNRLTDIRNKQEEILRDEDRFAVLKAQIGWVQHPSIPDWVHRLFARAPGGQASASTDAPSGQSPVPPADVGLPSGETLSRVIDAAAQPGRRTVECFQFAGVDPRYQGQANAKLRLFGIVDDDQRATSFLNCILRVGGFGDIGTGPDPVVASLAQGSGTTVQGMRDLVGALATWFLPALYGMLGSVICLLRAFLSDDERDPSALQMLVRVSLGTFAGVAIGWFMAGGAPKEVPLGVLTISFLVGYSINVFLAILDTFVKRLEGWATA